MKAIPPLVGKHDLTIKRGDTLSVVLTIRDGVTKVPFDFTDCTFRSQVRRAVDAPDVLSPLTINVIGAPTAGTLEVFLSPDESALIPSASLRRGVWDLEVTFPGNRVRTLVEGGVELSGDVSRP